MDKKASVAGSPPKKERPKSWRRDKRAFLRPFLKERFFRELLKKLGVKDSDDLNDDDFDSLCREVERRICKK